MMFISLVGLTSLGPVFRNSAKREGRLQKEQSSTDNSSINTKKKLLIPLNYTHLKGLWIPTYMWKVPNLFLFLYLVSSLCTLTAKQRWGLGVESEGRKSVKFCCQWQVGNKEINYSWQLHGSVYCLWLGRRQKRPHSTPHCPQQNNQKCSHNFPTSILELWFTGDVSAAEIENTES